MSNRASNTVMAAAGAAAPSSQRSRAVSSLKRQREVASDLEIDGSSDEETISKREIKKARVGGDEESNSEGEESGSGDAESNASDMESAPEPAPELGPRRGKGRQKTENAVSSILPTYFSPFQVCRKLQDMNHS